MKCPVCRASLVVVEREGIEVDWCVDCGGLWFDAGELELLAVKLGRPLAAHDLPPAAARGRPGRRRCPRCPRRLERLPFERQALELDRCPSHGIWLDRGELGSMLKGRAPHGADAPGAVLSFLGETFGGGTPPGNPGELGG